MRIDRKIVWLVLIACLVVLVWLAIDHLLFPDLPMPAGTPSITK